MSPIVNRQTSSLRAAKPAGRHRLSRRWAACLLVGTTLFGCQDRDVEDPAPPPNILLISVDSLRPDHLTSYGYDRPTSPTFDRLAEQGVLFEVATSSSSWTLPAHAALFTGLPDSAHGCERGSDSLPGRYRTLAESLASAGYRTGAVWSGPLLHPSFGLAQGFDDYLSHRPENSSDPASGPEGWTHQEIRSHEDVTGPAILETVASWLDHEPNGQPFFLFTHLWDVHYDFIPPPPLDREFDPTYVGSEDGTNLSRYVAYRRDQISADDLHHLKALYDGEILSVDGQIDSLVSLLEAHGQLENTLVVVTADHGEEFFEHGSFGHKKALYEESLRIPLLFYFPAELPARRIADPVRIVDIAPTLLAFAGAEPLPDILGRSLEPLLRGNPRAERPAISELMPGALDRSGWLSLRTSDLKMIADRWPGSRHQVAADSGAPAEETRLIELYDLESDPGETNNLLGVDPGAEGRARSLLEQAKAELLQLRARHYFARSPSNMTDSMRTELENLGYLIEPEIEFGADPDPIRVCDGSELGQTTLFWRVPSATGPMEIRVDAPDGILFAQIEPSGSAETGRWIMPTTEFYLVDPSGGNVLATLSVPLTDQGCP